MTFLHLIKAARFRQPVASRLNQIPQKSGAHYQVCILLRTDFLSLPTSPSTVPGTSACCAHTLLPFVAGSSQTSKRMSDQATSQRGGRSKSGCSTCRARKVRCDERPGICVNCERLNLSCSFEGDQEESSTKQHEATATAGFKRKRTFRSCVGCRASKVSNDCSRQALSSYSHRNRRDVLAISPSASDVARDH